ncbi:MAG: 30S ribosomal protein S3 [Proteobacteria bacterium]|nr:30S ribosomal protein S3 [Pseudomonadota bacterium]
MGQKVHPLGFRLGVIRSCESRWFSKRDYASLVKEDFLIRRYIHKEFTSAGICRIEIYRASENLKINIHCARPGVVIGKKGSEADLLKKKLQKVAKTKAVSLTVNVLEVKKPDLNARFVAFNVKQQLERRMSFRRVMKKAMGQALKEGAQGIKIEVSGRLGGADMARKEQYREGRVPLHTIRADVDYGTADAYTTYGITGIKVWIYKGEIFT